MLGPLAVNDLNNPPSGSEYNYSNKKPSITPRSFGGKSKRSVVSANSEGKVEKFLKISDFVEYIMDKMDIFLEQKLEGV